MKIAFVAWTRYHRRSQLLADHLGATVHYISCGESGQMLQAPLRYLVQGYNTWQILRRDRPDIVFVQNPPIFSALVVALYARRYAARYVIDSHTGAFFGLKWRWSLPLHRRLSCQAIATVVTNSHLERVVESWGARALIMGFTPGHYPAGERFAMDARFNVAVVSTSADDEPLEAVFEAARSLPDVCFFVTGDDRRLPQSLVAGKPANCRLTGFLSYERYVGLLRSANAVLDLTTRDHTLLMGGFEAFSVGTPLITSDWPVLKEYFSFGTVHVSDSPEAIREGVLRLRQEEVAFRAGALRMQERLDEEWRRKFAELQLLLKEGTGVANQAGEVAGS